MSLLISLLLAEYAALGMRETDLMLCVAQLELAESAAI